MALAPSADRVAAKWARVTPQRQQDYQEGVQAPRTPWAAAASGAAQRYQAGVTEAIAGGRFAKGIAKAGDARWAQKTLAKGPGRFAEGVAVSGPDYQQGMGPVLAAINAVALPPRQPTGSPGNIQRVAAIAAALRKLKTG